MQDDRSVAAYDFLPLDGEVGDVPVGGFDVAGDQTVGVDKAGVEFPAFEDRLSCFGARVVREDDPPADLPAVQVEVRRPVARSDPARGDLPPVDRTRSIGQADTAKTLLDTRKDADGEIVNPSCWS